LHWHIIPWDRPISTQSLTQAFMNALLIGYNIYRGNPFSIYGENVFLGVENLIIMALFFVYPIKKDIPKYIGYTVALFILSTPMILQLVPGRVQEFSITLSIVVCNMLGYL
jgi:hypothetical protein